MKRFLTLLLLCASALPVLAASPRQCVSYTPQQLSAIKRGELQLVVVITEFKPRTTGGSAGLVISLLTDRQKTRTELERVAIYPLKPFSVSQPAQYKRFSISLKEQAALIEKKKPICIEVAYAGTQRNAPLKFKLEWWKPVPTTK